MVARAETDAQGYVLDADGLGAKLSPASFLLPTAGALLTYGFGAYFELLPGQDLSPLMLVYGFPGTVLGFALKYAELLPVGLRSKPDALTLREKEATETQNQVRKDCCRYRYGDEQHLDEALAKVFIFNRPMGIPRRNSPRLTGLREEVIECHYGLIMEFDSPRLTNEEWESRLDKFTSFFGPGIKAQLMLKEGGCDVALVSDGSGVGVKKEGEEKKD